MATDSRSVAVPAVDRSTAGRAIASAPTRHAESAQVRGLSPDEVLISRRTWEHLRDALYRLEAASEDVAMDLLQGKPTKAEYVTALGHLSAAVRELQEIAVEPIALAGISVSSGPNTTIW